MPTRRGAAPPSKHPKKQGFSEGETKEVMMDFPESPALAQAVLEQSRALTALASQMASGEDAIDLSSSSGLSSRGSIGREAEEQVVSTQGHLLPEHTPKYVSQDLSPEVDMGTLVTRGVTPTLYLEMFDALGLLFVCLQQTAMDNGKVDLCFKHMLRGFHPSLSLFAVDFFLFGFSATYPLVFLDLFGFPLSALPCVTVGPLNMVSPDHPFWILR